MEVKASSPKPGLYHMDSVSDPEDKEISEDDDDDRNHKHRRREENSQSMEGDSSEQVLTRPYRKRNKTFGNGYPSRESGFNSNDSWRNFNDASQEKDFPGRFDRRRTNVPSFSRGALDTNPRARVNQSMPADPGPGKGRGRDLAMWGQHDPRFSQLDITAQLVQQGSVPPNLFSGRGLPTVPSTSWNAFGMIPGLPTGGLDTLHSIGFQGPIRPPINPSRGIGIPRQRCRDFEERGFCLRGDMCPMEHGINRIVIDDVQSLSQFNLPVSLPAVHVLGTTAGQGPLPANASTGTFMSNKSLQIKNSKNGMADEEASLKSTFVGSSMVGMADLYDPDQPLWTNNCAETSPALVAVNGPNFNEIQPLTTQKDSSNQNSVRLSDPPEDTPRTNDGTSVASPSSSVWGRIGGSKSKLEVRPKSDSTSISSININNDMKKGTDSIEFSQGIAHQGEKNADNVGSHFPGFSSKPLSDQGHNFRRPSQRAARTVFVSGIPPKDNRREALFSHFKKFGEVIDIYIPSNSERAFVQFLKREEAEAALKAPDAVMGNRFIKLRWANRDNIPDGRNGGPSNPSNDAGGLPVALGPPSLPSNSKGHDSVRTTPLKGSVSTAPVTTSDVAKLTVNSPKVPPPSQKKLENLEVLKEQLRKKQEMLDQKRNEFRLQLSKLEKQASGVKDDRGLDTPSKGETSPAAVDVPKVEIAKSASDSGFLSSPKLERVNDSCGSGENDVARNSKPSSNLASLEYRSLKPSIRPLAPSGPPFVKKYKLDNRPTVFRVLPPLPTDLANVSALKEHFSAYGELSIVDLDTLEHKDNKPESEVTNITARIAYTTRQSAEKAFLNGKCWQGHQLQFVWVTGGNASKATTLKEKPSSTIEQSLDPDTQPAAELAAVGIETTAAAPEVVKSKNLSEKEENIAQGDLGGSLKSGQEGKSP